MRISESKRERALILPSESIFAVFRRQRYDENPDDTILKSECSAIGIGGVANETRLARSRYVDLLQLRNDAPVDVGLAQFLKAAPE